MISTGELKKGVAIELDGELWQILDYHHIKMGRGSAQVRITLRNIKRGQTVERSFQAGTKWPRASMEKRPVQFLYRDGDDYHFMDTDTYDQFHLTTEQLGDAAHYMKDGMMLDRTSYQGETIGVELPGHRRPRRRRHRAGLRRRHPDRRPQARHDRDRPGRDGADLRRAGRHDPRGHAHRGVPDPGLSRHGSYDVQVTSRGGIESLLFLMDEAFRGAGIEASNESQALLPNLRSVPDDAWHAVPTASRARSRRSRSTSARAR